MSIISDLFTTLNTNAGLQAIVGLGTSPQTSKIYAGYAAGSAIKPFIMFEIITDTREHTIPGVSDMERQLIQINCYEDTYEDAQTLADAVFSALEGNGYMQNRTDLYDSGTQTYAAIIDWSFLA